MGIETRGVIPALELGRDMVIARSLRSAVVFTPRADAPAGDEDPADEQAQEQTAAADSLGRLVVRFTRFGTWYRIDDWWEGTFLERTVKGAFTKTIAERGPEGTGEVRSLFDHGWDFYIGDKILTVPDRLAEEDDFAILEGPLLDTSYNRDLLPGLRAGGYGSSFMFQVIKDSWDHEPEPSDYNPEGIAERTINEVRLFEAGPVTWPANPDATAEVNSAMRSDTARLYERMQRRDPSSVEAIRRRIMDLRSTPAGDGAGPTTPDRSGAATDPTAEPVRHSDVSARARRQRAIREAVIAASR